MLRYGTYQIQAKSVRLQKEVDNSQGENEISPDDTSAFRLSVIYGTQSYNMCTATPKVMGELPSRR